MLSQTSHFAHDTTKTPKANALDANINGETKQLTYPGMLLKENDQLN
jgi:hypothetical protein